MKKIKAIDVSKHQGIIQWDKVKNDGNNAKLNIDSLMQKVKMYSSVEDIKKAVKN